MQPENEPSPPLVPRIGALLATTGLVATLTVAIVALSAILARGSVGELCSAAPTTPAALERVEPGAPGWR